MPKPLPPPPPGWEISGKAEGGKRTMRCTKSDRRGSQCIHEIRFTSNPPRHQCSFQSQHELDQTQLHVDRWAALPFHQRLQIEVAALVAITDAPLEIVENELFTRVLNSLVDIGRNESRIRIGSEGCKLTRTRTRRTMVEESNHIHEEMIAKFAQMPCASFAIDAGTIERRHFLDIMILAPYSKIKPFLYDVIEKATLTADDYGNIVMTAIKELYQKGVKIRSIVGDNLPAQVTALAHWSSRSCLKRGEESYLHGIKYSPCMCHFVQLVVGDLITGSCCRSFEDVLQKMISVANFSEVRSIVNSRCPQSVKTRWLSRSEALNWLLSREGQLSEINLRLFPKARRSQIQAAVTKSNFAILAIYHRIISPFTQAVKFFEQDHVTLCHVYLALKTLKNHFREEEHSHQNSDAEYATCCSTAVSVIQQRRWKLLDKNLLRAAFWLTSFGCQSLSDKISFIPIPYRLDLEHHAPCSLPPARGPLERVWNNIDGSRDLDEQGLDEVDYSYTGEVIMEDELQEVPKIGYCKNQILKFLNEFLPILITEDLDPDSSELASSEIRRQVEESLQFFFCNPESIAKCRNTPGDIERQVELWNWLKFMAQGRISDQVVAKVISIVSIPASEASCERSLSRQKRIMGHFRVKSNPGLLRARFLFESGNF
jgi:hypothetical protein